VPFFSILMPTRNRASLLRSALQTAVSQEFADYEIVVSDNNSRDETRQVIEGFSRDCDRIKYVNPGRDLSMCDNWEFIMSHATGEYVLYLSDDDALAANALTYVHETLSRFPINTLVWERGYYQHADIPDDNLRCTFFCERRSGNLYEVKSRAVADAFSDFNTKTYGILPKMLNCAVSSSVLRACKEKTGYFFLPPFPDYSAACHLLGIDDSYHLLDLPLYICGVSRISNAGIQYDRKRKFDDYISLLGLDLLEGVPYPMRYLNPSYFLATYLKFRKIYPETFAGPPNMDAYLKSLFAELMTFEDYEDISEELQTLAGYMRDFYGGGETFDALLKERRDSEPAAAEPEQAAESLGASLRKTAGKIVRSNDLLQGLARRAKRTLRPAPPAQAPATDDHSTDRHISRTNVQTIFDASQILGGVLSSEAKSPARLSPIAVESLSRIEGWA
jgi:glycosyltransferase involved in cell wall biosynthesis